MIWNGLELPDKPYYQDDAVLIYNADCRDILPKIPDKSIDLVLTDPPYGVGIDYSQFEDTPDNLKALIDSVLPLLPRPLVCTTGVKNIWLYPRPDWIICWFMPNGVGVGPWGFCTWQPILVYGKDPFSGKGSRPDGFEKVVANSEDNGHPCPKPISVMRWLVERCTIYPGQIILDPFLGSGTTARAAKDCNRKCIGIEIEEKYCEIAAKRCSQTVMRLDV